MFMKVMAMILTLLPVIAIVSCMFPFHTLAAAEALIGDIDKDGDITVSDSLGALRAAAGLKQYSAEDVPVYDVTGDREVGVDDALGLLRSAVGISDGDYGYAGVELSFAPNADALGYKYTQQSIDNAIVSQGDTAKLARVMQRAADGGRVNVVVLGGSITAGSSATETQNRYANRVTSWWKENFPQGKINLFNMGIGATGSMLGVHRLEDDVLSRKPDFLIVEFAINDSDSDYQYYEGIIRRVLANDPETAVIMLFMQDQSGWNTQNTEIPIGNYYRLPMISYRDATNPLIKAGTIKWTDISPDNIHPNDVGHGMVASLITSYLDGVKAKYDRLSRVIPAFPTSPLYSDRYDNAKLWMGGTLAPTQLGGWSVEPNGGTFYHLKGAWTISKKGKAMKFTATFRELNILYWRFMPENNPNAGKIKVSVDGGAAIELNALIESGGWGNYLAKEHIYDSDEPAEHEITFTYVGGNFTLSGLMLS
ncbi:MAG: hypothetical protein J5756_05155 [Clostridia bacterium]|nr:hypothetical protein [Clostridia bacterium]